LNSMKTQLGIDIGSFNIKVVEVSQEEKSIRILNAAYTPLSSAGFLSEAKTDREAVAKQIKSLLSENGIKSKLAVASLTEMQTFTKIIETPKLSEKELSQALKWEAEQYIPMPLEDVNMDFVILNSDVGADKMQILLAAAPISLVEKYISTLSSCGLEVTALENEGIALLRVFKRSDENRLIVNLAASTTNIYIFKKEIIVLARTIASGSNVLTRVLASDLNLPAASAEEYKRTYGLNEAQMEGRAYNILKPFIDNLVSEITQSLTYFKEKYPNEVIKQIVITGGGAMLPQISTYLSQKLQIETIISNPWEGFTIERKVSDKVRGEESLFSTATGCAIREIEA